MWALNNRTAYAAERTWVRDKTGTHHWIVCVKASFDLTDDGALSLADEQPPPLLAADYFGEPGTSSVRYEADLVAMKPNTDITVLGQAHAPFGRKAEAVDVSLRVDEVSKTLRVFGNRTIDRVFSAVVYSSPVPFVTQPIRYEHAFGGIDLSDPNPSKQALDIRNPAGCGFAAHSKSLVGKPAPHVEYPHGDIAKVGPAGFGPIASYWSPRMELAGTYDQAWSASKKPLLPDDYDERFTLCSPVDQRPARHLSGGEPVELLGLTPSGRLRFELPRIFLTFSTRFGSRREEHRSRLASVMIEPDERKLRMVWQTSLKVASRQAEYLDDTTISEKRYLR